MDITRYVVSSGPDADDYTHWYDSYDEAKTAAMAAGQCLVAFTFEYTDSELIDDFRMACVSCGTRHGADDGSYCPDCGQPFCDNCYDTGKGDGCHCHPVDKED